MRRSAAPGAIHLAAVSAFALAATFVAAPSASADTFTASAATIAAASFNAAPPAADAPLGVSPEVFYDAPTGTYYLLTTSMPATQYTSKDGRSWTPTTTALPMGVDWSIVQEGPASYRLYYAEIAPSPPGSGPAAPCTPGSKVLRYATSTDLVTWSTQPGVLLGDLGCGVPHVMKTRAGSYFLYFNKGEPVHGVYIARSTDGLTWSTPQGPINNDTGLVDPAPLELPDGTFVMVASSLGGPGQYQHLQLLASSNAIDWVKRKSPLYAPSGAGAFDPSIELVNGQLRVWFGYSPGGRYDAARITDGVLRLGAPRQAKAKVGATCAKKGTTSGKLVCRKKGGSLVWARR